MSFQRYALLGASRGLGRAFFNQLATQAPESEALIMARRPHSDQSKTVQFASHDFSRPGEVDTVYDRIARFAPESMIYFAGGGPHGRYESKDWKDHEWALRVTFLFPAELLHRLFRQPLNSLRQIILIGSAIAENQPDPLAASYSMAKHGMVGLVRNLKAENPHFDIRLFSPGYMATDLLPKNSVAVLSGRAESPTVVARTLWDWHLTS